MRDVVWLAAAERDLMRLYDRAEETQGGDAFLDTIQQSVGNLRGFPFIAPTFAGGIRRLLISKHPLGVFYAVEGNRVMILRVLDLRQDPQTIRRKLDID
jgi:plasmid stabilization system protein ParE